LILKAHQDLAPLPIECLEAEHARQIPLLDRAAAVVYGQHFTKRAFAPMPLPVGNIEHMVIGEVEDEILVRIYKPKIDRPTDGWPILVYFHGGGWVIATLDTYDSSCRALCNSADCIIISVHYRQAPEYPWPAAVEDAFEAYRWTIDNAETIGGNPDKIAVGGESAGGNLAAVVSLLAREEGLIPVHQLLIYPVTDLVDGQTSISAQENAEAKPLNQAMLNWFYDQYVNSDVLRTNFKISPMFAETHANLPPTTIILAEIDPLRHDGESYAAKLQTAGVPVQIKIFEGVTHEFFGLAGLVNEATEAVKFAGEALKTAFNPQ
jgi:acetyl esterase